MKPVEPIDTVDLFLLERQRLLELLAGLSPEEWQQPTACPDWSVKDVALHLFGDDVGLLSRNPDFTFPVVSGVEIGWEALVDFINQANAVWIDATRRIGNDLLLKLLAFTSDEVHRRLSELDLFAIGEPVDWAGPNPAPIWLDVAREYTERWMHQQHIREAVNAPALTEPNLFAPVLDAFVRALPHTYRNVSAPLGTLLEFIISGPAGGSWYLQNNVDGWQLFTGASDQTPAASVTVDQNIAWRIFTKGITPTKAEAQAELSGDLSLARPALQTVAIIA